MTMTYDSSSSRPIPVWSDTRVPARVVRQGQVGRPAGLPSAGRADDRAAGRADDRAAGRADARAGAPVRLTRRGRVVIVLGVLVALLLVGFTLGRVSGSRAAGVTTVRTVVVQPGDTVWSVASRVDPGHDPRLEVGRLIAANHLHGGSVRVGERLVVSG